jgi:hypothetical protein
MTGSSAAMEAESERRLWVAIGISIVLHALIIAALRGALPRTYSFEGGAGNLPVLQAYIVGAPLQSESDQPQPLEPAATAIDPDLVVPPKTEPLESMSGHPPPAAAALPGGKPSSAAPGAPDINVSVGTIADPAQLGPDYVAQLAQRFPNPAQKVPVLLGAPVVDYPRTAIEKGMQGRFAAVVAIDALGKVADARLVIDDPIFGPALLDALKRMEFAPAQDGGNPIPYWAIVEFVFTLGKPEPRPAIVETFARSRPAPQRGRAVGR